MFCGASSPKDRSVDLILFSVSMMLKATSGVISSTYLAREITALDFPTPSLPASMMNSRTGLPLSKSALDSGVTISFLDTIYVSSLYRLLYHVHGQVRFLCQLHL